MNLETLTSLNFVFIVGRGRSGTTLLQDILDRHPEILFPIESRLILYLSDKYAGTHKITSAFITALLNDLYSEHKFKKHWKVPRADMARAFFDFENTRLDLEAICKIIYLQYISMYDKTVIRLIGDKNPTYSLFIPTLIRIFPSAKFIHLVRNPKDNVVSHRKTFGRTNLALMARGWVCYNQAIEEQKKLCPDKFITIRYEDLVSDPMQVLRLVSKHIAIPITSINLDPISDVNEKYRTRLKSREFEHFHKNLLTPISAEQVEKWKNNLTAHEIELLEYVTHRPAHSYGYEVTPFRRKAAFVSKSLLAYIKYGFYNRVIAWYYNSPMFARHFTRAVSGWLNKKFSYINYFNFGDYTFKD